MNDTKLQLDGNGTESNPYKILTVTDLQNMSEDLTACYKLGDNIDASKTKTWNNGKGFEPIGDEENRFTGILDGNGYSITNLYINRTDSNNIGLFSVLDEYSVIKNITIKNCVIKGREYVGCIAGSNGLYNGGVIQNITVSTVEKIIGFSSVGGIVGYNAENGELVDLYSDSIVYGDWRVGGIVGNNDGDVSSASTSGVILGKKGELGFTGGVIGQNHGVVSSLESTAKVYGNYCVGGIIGWNNGIINGIDSNENVIGETNIDYKIGKNEDKKPVELFQE